MRKSSQFLFLLSALFLFVFEIQFVLFSTTLFQLFIGRVLSCLVAAGVYKYFAKKGWDGRFPLLQLLFILFFGPFGVFMTLSAFGVFILFSRKNSTIEDLLSSLMPESALDSSTNLYERLKYGLEKEAKQKTTLPFIDVMKYGSEKEKRAAIEKALRYFRPEFSEALKLGLQDKSNGIRIMSATAMTTIENLYFQEFTQLESQVLENPDDPELIKRLGLHCLEYAQAQILDPERKEKMLIEAQKSFLKHEELVAIDDERDRALAKVYLMLGMPERALEHMTSESLETKKLVMEAEYMRKNYKRVRELAENGEVWKEATSV